MATIKLNYDLIGSIPEMEPYREQLPSMLNEFERTGEGNLGNILAYCAQHFFGLTPGETFENAGQMIDVLRSVDEELKYK